MAQFKPQKSLTLAVEAQLLNDAGFYLHERGRYTDAEPLYQRALAIREKALGPEHPYVANCLENYALCLRAMDRSQEAEPLESRARAIRAKNGLIRNPSGELGR